VFALHYAILHLHRKVFRQKVEAVAELEALADQHAEGLRAEAVDLDLVNNKF